METNNYRTISEVAEMFKVDVWTIRLWVNRIGLLKHGIDPKGELTFTGEEVEKIGLICRMIKTKGLKIKDIRKRFAAAFSADSEDEPADGSDTD